MGIGADPLLSGAALRILASKARKEKRRGVAAALEVKKILLVYFETDFLNMRSIFSLIASIAVEFACAVDRA